MPRAAFTQIGKNTPWMSSRDQAWNQPQGEPVGALVAQSSPTFCDPMDWSLPGSSVRGTLQARIPEWVAISFSRGSSPPRDQTWVSCIAVGFFTNWATSGSLDDSSNTAASETPDTHPLSHYEVYDASLNRKILPVLIPQENQGRFYQEKRKVSRFTSVPHHHNTYDLKALFLTAALRSIVVFGKILLRDTCGIYIVQASKWFDKAEQKTKAAFLLYPHLKKTNTQTKKHKF